MKQIITTDKAPAAVGPYSQAVKVNGLIFASGQIPLDPQSGKLVEGDVRVQTQRALTNLKNVLEAAGSGLDKVVKTTVFLNDIADFAPMNEVYKTFFTGDFPARCAFAVAALPLGALVEVEAIACE